MPLQKVVKNGFIHIAQTVEVVAYDETSEVGLLKRRRKDWIKSAVQCHVHYPWALALNVCTSHARTPLCQVGHAYERAKSHELGTLKYLLSGK